jgi:hypothetical protein
MFHREQFAVTAAVEAVMVDDNILLTMLFGRAT